MLDDTCQPCWPRPAPAHRPCRRLSRTARARPLSPPPGRHRSHHRRRVVMAIPRPRLHHAFPVTCPIDVACRCRCATMLAAIITRPSAGRRHCRLDIHIYDARHGIYKDARHRAMPLATYSRDEMIVSRQYRARQQPWRFSSSPRRMFRRAAAPRRTCISLPSRRRTRQYAMRRRRPATLPAAGRITSRSRHDSARWGAMPMLFAPMRDDRRAARHGLGATARSAAHDVRRCRSHAFTEQHTKHTLSKAGRAGGHLKRRSVHESHGVYIAALAARRASKPAVYQSMPRALFSAGRRSPACFPCLPGRRRAAHAMPAQLVQCKTPAIRSPRQMLNIHY